MINSIINGKELDIDGRIMPVKDIYGNTINSVRMFDKDLKAYVPDLLDNFERWKNVPLEIRLDSVLSIKEQLENEKLADKLVKSICSEIGKPLVEAETEISEAIGLLDYFLLYRKFRFFQKVKETRVHQT